MRDPPEIDFFLAFAVLYCAPTPPDYAGSHEQKSAIFEDFLTIFFDFLQISGKKIELCIKK